MAANDPELTAMAVIAEAVAQLDIDARQRILTWAANRFGVSLAAESSGPPELRTRGSAEIGQFPAFVDLVDAAGPKNGIEYALVGGFWLQVCEGAPDFPSQQVNDALKDVGHGVGNITDAFASLQSRKPALVRQVMKSGKTRQARKRYKLTAAGSAYVEEMLRRSREA